MNFKKIKIQNKKKAIINQLMINKKKKMNNNLKMKKLKINYIKTK